MKILKYIGIGIMLLVATILLVLTFGKPMMFIGVVLLAVTLFLMKKVGIRYLYGVIIVIVLVLLCQTWLVPFIGQQLRTHFPLSTWAAQWIPVQKDLELAKKMYPPATRQEITVFRLAAVADSIDAEQIKKQADLLQQKLKDQGYLSDSDWVELERISKLTHDHQDKMKKFIRLDDSSGSGGYSNSDSAKTVRIPASVCSWIDIGDFTGQYTLETNSNIDIGGYTVNADGHSANLSRPMIPADQTNWVYQHYAFSAPFGSLVYQITGDAEIISGSSAKTANGILVYGAEVSVKGNKYHIQAMVSDSDYSDNLGAYQVHVHSM